MQGHEIEGIMQLLEAEAIARGIMADIEPHCVKARIAGSIRRRKSEVKDIELVVIPKWTTQADPSDLFGEREICVNALHQAMQGRYQFIKPGTPDILPWEAKPDGKYWRIYLPDVEMKLDLFLCSERNWGAIYLIRTGSAEFSHAVATHAQRIGRPFENGHLTIAGLPVDTPIERHVFDTLSLCYVEPAARIDGRAVRESS